MGWEPLRPFLCASRLFERAPPGLATGRPAVQGIATLRFDPHGLSRMRAGRLDFSRRGE